MQNAGTNRINKGKIKYSSKTHHGSRFLHSLINHKLLFLYSPPSPFISSQASWQSSSWTAQPPSWRTTACVSSLPPWRRESSVSFSGITTSAPWSNIRYKKVLTTPLPQLFALFAQVRLRITRGAHFRNCRNLNRSGCVMNCPSSRRRAPWSPLLCFSTEKQCNYICIYKPLLSVSLPIPLKLLSIFPKCSRHRLTKHVLQTDESYIFMHHIYTVLDQS